MIFSRKLMGNSKHDLPMGISPLQWWLNQMNHLTSIDIDWLLLTWKIDSPCPSVQQFFPYKSSFSSENQGTAQFSLVKRASFCAFVCRFPDLVVPHRPCATCLLRRAAQRCLRRVASRVGGFGAAGAEGAAGPARERPGNGWILPQIRGLNHQEMMISQVKL